MSFPFFATYSDYRSWIHSMPDIQLCRQEEPAPTLSRLLCEPLLPDLRGPYYLTSAFLALRVGAEYRVLHRVASQEEADVRWYAPEQAHGKDDGYVYAAYVYQHQQRLADKTLQEVRTKLSQFLRSPRVTRRL